MEIRCPPRFPAGRRDLTENPDLLPVAASPLDPLSDVLRSVRLRGAVFFDVRFAEEWAVESAPASFIADAVLPGAEHVLGYHFFAKGEGWATLAGTDPVRVATGDIIMFPQGNGHVLSSRRGMAAPAGDPDWVFTLGDMPKPVPVAYHQGVLQPGISLPAEEAKTMIVCGFIGCDLRPFNPLIGALPRMVHLTAGSVGDWVGSVLREAVRESRERRPGSDVVLERASEMVFVNSARHYLDHLPEESSGWLAGLRDRHVGRALALLHRHPEREWSIEELSHQVALSRSALHERFVRFVGQPPVQYLANWRMQLAANLLRTGHGTVAAIAQEVGYESEAAFNRAFKRTTGLPPAAWRRAQAG